MDPVGASVAAMAWSDRTFPLYSEKQADHSTRCYLTGAQTTQSVSRMAECGLRVARGGSTTARRSCHGCCAECLELENQEATDDRGFRSMAWHRGQSTMPLIRSSSCTSHASSQRGHITHDSATCTAS